ESICKMKLSICNLPNEKIKKGIKKVNINSIKNSIKSTQEKLKDFRERGIKFGEGVGISENLKQRIITAAILVPFVIVLLYSSVFLFNGLILLIAVLMALEWHEITKKGEDKKFWLILGLCYVIIPSLLLMTLRDVRNGADIILWMFAIVWGTDTAAYFVGKNIGGPQLAPKISPNKTWSGLFGGIFASMVIGFIGGLFFEGSIRFFIFFSGFLAIVEQIGDLFESKIKRKFNVKESGTVIPGHGGILDRVDGLLFVVPIVILIVWLGGERVF
ncbi:phosphatidate cytidylyltransferase, partial [Pseudomonadota bacterium]